jgi:glycine/D-amino acid oxidase-like deaminating enzyme
MDLKSGDLFWPHRSRSSPIRDALADNVSCDVIVIGAGLSGAMVAHALSREGLDVVVVDRRDVAFGSTSASTALVLYEIDVPLFKLKRQRGHAAAVKTYHRCLEAIDELESLIGRLNGQCEFRRRHSLYLASQPQHLKEVRREYIARKKAGFDVQFLAQREIEQWFSFSASGAIYSEGAAEMDPFKLTLLLMNDSIRRGARLFTRTKAASITERARGVTVCTAKRHRIRARWAVVATGFETSVPAVRRVVKLKSSYALTTQPVSAFPGWHERCLIWETRRPYLYLRTTADNRIVIGGEDEDFLDARKRDWLIPGKCAVLNHKLRRMFPHIKADPAYAWAGTFGETKDGLPYIGPLKSDSRILYALCYGANGTNFAVIAADILRDFILQRENVHRRLFGFDRQIRSLGSRQPVAR